MNPNQTDFIGTAPSRPARGIRTLQALLATNAVLLAVLVWMSRGGFTGPSEASAQSARAAQEFANEGVSNVGPRQRKSMLEGIVAIEERLASIEQHMREGALRVEVIEEDEDR